MNEENTYTVISENLEDYSQIRLSVSVFNGVEYLSLRKYYLDFTDEFLPTKQGISIPLTIENVVAMFEGIAKIMASAETKDIIEKYFKETILNEYNRKVSEVLK